MLDLYAILLGGRMEGISRYFGDLAEWLPSIKEMRIGSAHRSLYIDPSRDKTDDAHVHPYYEIYLNLSGDVSFLHNGLVYKIGRGDLIFSRPGEVHHCIYNSPSTHEHICLWFDAEGESELARLISERGVSGYIRLGEERALLLASLIDGIAELDYAIERAARVVDIVSRLSAPRENFRPDAASGALGEIVAYINESFATIGSVAELAERFHVSRSSLGRLFREELHLSPSELIRAERLAFAERLLSEGASVTDACYRSGFSDCSRFIAAFRKRYGTTPLKYKRKTIGFQP